jgi:hypothetical protein
VAPGSPELGRGEEGATVNSMAGKRPRIHGQRGRGRHGELHGGEEATNPRAEGENGGERVSGGPEKLR